MEPIRSANNNNNNDKVATAAAGDTIEIKVCHNNYQEAISRMHDMIGIDTSVNSISLVICGKQSRLLYIRPDDLARLIRLAPPGKIMKLKMWRTGLIGDFTPLTNAILSCCQNLREVYWDTIAVIRRSPVTTSFVDQNQIEQSTSNKFKL